MGKRGAKAGTPEARRGGEAMREKYGREFFSQIGRMGARENRLRHGLDFYTKIGAKGGSTTKARHPGHYQRIGRMGGLKSRQTKDTSTE